MKRRNLQAALGFVLAAGASNLATTPVRAQAEAASAESAPAVFSRLQAKKNGSRKSVKELYGKLWQNREAALPYLSEQAKKGNLLAQAVLGRMTQPQKYVAFEGALDAYTKRFDNVPDETNATVGAMQNGVMQAPPPVVRPHVIQVDLKAVSKLKAPLPGLSGSNAVPFLVEKLGWTANSGTERQMALVALGLTRQPQAYDALAEVVKANTFGEINFAVSALGSFGSKSALSLLADVLRRDVADADYQHAPFYSSSTQEHTAEVLGEVGDASVLPTLEIVRDSSRYGTVRRLAKQAIEAIRRREQRGR